jgi:hypothetical protein
VRRAGVALASLLAVLAGGCGAADQPSAKKTTTREFAAQSSLPATTGAAGPRLVEVDDGERLLGLQLETEPDCFGVEFANGYDGGVQFRESGCIGKRLWHVVVGTGGQPGSVDWTLVMGATRPEVDRIVVSGVGRDHEVQTETVEGWDPKIFRLKLAEGITAIAAFDSEDRLVAEAAIPTLAEQPCDWLCEGEGPWGIQFDLDAPLDPGDFERQPDVHLLSRDAQVKSMLEGKRFYLSTNDDWGGCVGVQRGGSWAFNLEEGYEIQREEWPTVDRSGRPITVHASEPAERVVVDFDRDRGQVISLLPYELGGFPLVAEKPSEAPLATEEPREDPLNAKDCRRLG